MKEICFSYFPYSNTTTTIGEHWNDIFYCFFLFTNYIPPK